MFHLGYNNKFITIKMLKRILTTIKKIYFFIYYCNYRIMNIIADRSMKNSPVHGFTWPSLIFFMNLITFALLLYGESIQKMKELTIYSVIFLYCSLIFNYFIFDHKNRYLRIIDECKLIPERIRYIGIVFFTLYSIFSILGLLIVAFTGWKIT